MSATSGLGGAPFTSAFFRSRRRRTRTMPLAQQVWYADNDDAGATVLNDWMWPVVSGETSGQVKVYNGSAWTGRPVKVWSGSAWVVKPVKRWNGSAWVETNY